jgi:hypothetical protein
MNNAILIDLIGNSLASFGGLPELRHSSGRHPADDENDYRDARLVDVPVPLTRAGGV